MNIQNSDDSIIDEDVAYDISSNEIVVDSDVSVEESIEKTKFCVFTHPRPEKFCGAVDKLRSPLEIPIAYRHIFGDYESFNIVQSTIFDDILYTNKPIVVSAPTGSGKTVLFELAIIQLLLALEDDNFVEDFKIIYLAPIKALCTERYFDWTKKFNSLGISCYEVTGDSDVSDVKELENYHILISTPEKWDILTRKWRETPEFVESIKLFLIDEIHLVNENRRGPILEAIVSRMKTICKLNRKYEKKTNLRFVGVSATIPNVEDLAMWLGGTQSILYKLSEDSRPIPLRKYVFGYMCAHYTTYFRFDMSLNYKLSGLIAKYSEGKPTLIFCSTRKGVEIAANVLQTNLKLNFHVTEAEIQKLGLHDTKLKQTLPRGIAFHHAGMIPEDRNIIEDLFRRGMIPVLLCTSTLAMGVNLPAHLVIIKSTQAYIEGKVSDYSECSILQMMGRAGRPQFDQFGVAIIMTEEKNKQKYENLINGTAPVESHLHKHLAEHLNSEIVLQTITDLAIAMDWLRSTFLYVRAIKNPLHYGFEPGMAKDRIEKKLEEMCLVGINALEKNDLITKDQNDGLQVCSTVCGKLMARYCLNFNTMKSFRQIKGTENLPQLFNILANCHEFSDFNVRTSDKRFLNELNKSKDKKNMIRFPIKGKIKTVSEKVSCLMQASLGNLTISDSSLYQEAQKIMKLSEKISKAMSEYIRLSDKDYVKNIYKATLSSVILIKCFSTRLWENTPFLCRQFKKIGVALSNLLVDADKTTFQSILDTHPRELERIVRKTPPFGSNLIERITKLPRFEISIEIMNLEQGKLSARQVNADYEMEDDVQEKVYIIIGDEKNNLLFFKENVPSILSKDGIFEKTFRIYNSDLVNAHIIHQQLIGVDSHICFNIKTFEINRNNNEINPPELNTTTTSSTSALPSSVITVEKPTSSALKTTTKKNMTGGKKSTKQSTTVFEMTLNNSILLYREQNHHHKDINSKLTTFNQLKKSNYNKDEQIVDLADEHHHHYYRKDLNEKTHNVDDDGQGLSITKKNNDVLHKRKLEDNSLENNRKMHKTNPVIEIENDNDMVAVRRPKTMITEPMFDFETLDRSMMNETNTKYKYKVVEILEKSDKDGVKQPKVTESQLSIKNVDFKNFDIGSDLDIFEPVVDPIQIKSNNNSEIGLFSTKTQINLTMKRKSTLLNLLSISGTQKDTISYQSNTLYAEDEDDDDNYLKISMTEKQQKFFTEEENELEEENDISRSPLNLSLNPIENFLTISEIKCNNISSNHKQTSLSFEKQIIKVKSFETLMSESELSKTTSLQIPDKSTACILATINSDVDDYFRYKRASKDLKHNCSSMKLEMTGIQRLNPPETKLNNTLLDEDDEFFNFEVKEENTANFFTSSETKPKSRSYNTLF